MTKSNIVATLVIIVLVLGIWFFQSRTSPLPPISDDVTPAPVNTVQSGKIDEHLTINMALRDVNFCGKTYKVKQIIIDGADAVQRIAELATKDLIPNTIGDGSTAENICKNIELNTPNYSPGKTELNIGEVKKFPGKDVGQNGDMYVLDISASRFSVNTMSDKIYLNSSFDGSLVGPIGKLK